MTQCMVGGVPCSRVSGKVFSKFWIDLNHGVLTVGHGEPGQGVCHQWRDAQEIPGIQVRIAGPESQGLGKLERRLRLDGQEGHP